MRGKRPGPERLPAAAEGAVRRLVRGEEAWDGTAGGQRLFDIPAFGEGDGPVSSLSGGVRRSF
jgi:hypothetical protein